MDFTEDEREFIREMKRKLEFYGVPREQWAKAIQQELYNYRKKVRRDERIANQGPLMKFLRKIGHLPRIIFEKVFSGTFLMD